MPPEPTKNSYGSTVGIVVLLIVIVIGAFYVMSQRATETAEAPTMEESGNAPILDTAAEASTTIEVQ